MATILTFSTQGHPRAAAPRPGTPAEIIVFPQTDISALCRLSEAASEAMPLGDHAAAAPGDDTPT